MTKFNPQDSLGFQCTLTLKAFLSNLGQRLDGSGISPVQFRLLAHLVAQGPRTQAELSELLSISPPSTVKLVDRLERDGWVAREADSRDRRVKRIVMTEQAANDWPALAVHAQGLLDQAYQGLSEKEINSAIQVLTQVRKNLGMDCC